MQNLLDYASGRASRTDWWIMMFWVLAVQFLVMFLDAMIKPGNWLPKIVLFLLSIISTVYFVLESIRRLHDRDKSGWWFLVYLIPLIGPVWMLIELGMLSGTVGNNRFGSGNRRMLKSF